MNLLRLKDGNYTNRKFNERGLLLVALVLACFAISPVAQAVTPPPDGGYPGGNTAEGTNALLSLTTGLYNTGIGIFSLESLTTGSFCTGVGAGTLLVNTADQNTATGAGALLSNATGFKNTANGHSLFLVARPEQPTRPTVRAPYCAIPLAHPIRRSVRSRSLTTPLAA